MNPNQTPSMQAGYIHEEAGHRTDERKLILYILDIHPFLMAHLFTLIVAIARVFGLEGPVREVQRFGFPWALVH